MTKTIVTHPDNLELLKKELEKKYPKRPPMNHFGIDLATYFMPTIKTNKYMEKDKPSGKYRLPDGSVLDKEEFVIKTQFITYGPEDIDCLVYAGVIEELREPLFYEVDMNAFRMRINCGVQIHNPRAMVFGSV